jgi:RimJ/RimL family protein N-acetyltransferase
MKIGLELRAPLREDLELFFEFQRDPVAIKMAGFHPRSLDAFMEHWEKILADPAVTKSTIVWDGRVAGNIVCFEVGDKRTVGYWLGSTYWGKGLATDALKQFVRQVQERPLYAYLAAHNHASRRVLEKCGFVMQGSVDTPEGLSPLDGEELLMKLGSEET